MTSHWAILIGWETSLKGFYGYPTVRGCLRRRLGTCTVSHLHTDSNLLVLLQTEACDPSWQHPSIRTDKLTQQQDILREQEKVKTISATATLTAVILRCCADPRSAYRTQNKAKQNNDSFLRILAAAWQQAAFACCHSACQLSSVRSLRWSESSPDFTSVNTWCQLQSLLLHCCLLQDSS